MTQLPPRPSVPVIVLPDGPDGASATVTVVTLTVVEEQQVFDPNNTAHFQTRMKRAPVWFVSIAASNHREKYRFREELAHIKGAWPLLMKQRKGGTWTLEEKVRLKAMVRSASSVRPYLFIWPFRGPWCCCLSWRGFWTGSARSARWSAAAARNSRARAGLCIKSASSPHGTCASSYQNQSTREPCQR